MEIRSVDHWSSAAQIVIVAAQENAFDANHHHTTTAHVARAFLDIGIVRRELAERASVEKAEKACDRLLLIARKGAAQRPTFHPDLMRLVFEPATTEGPRSIAALLRGFGVSEPLLQGPVVMPLVDRAEAIAARLEDERVRETFAKMMTFGAADRFVIVRNGIASAVELGHRMVTPRHVVHAWLHALKDAKSLTEEARTAVKGGLERLEELLVRTSVKRTQQTVLYSPRLLGVVSDTVLDEGKTLIARCVEGDDALSFVVEVSAKIAAGRAQPT